MVPLAAVPTSKREPSIESGEARWRMSQYGSFLRKGGKEKGEEDKGGASAIADRPEAEETKPDEEQPEWPEEEAVEVKQEEEGQEQEEEKREGNIRSSGSARPAPLLVFHKVKQKVADLGWWVGGVHQVVIWVGTARLDRNRAAGVRRLGKR